MVKSVVAPVESPTNQKEAIAAPQFFELLSPEVISSPSILILNFPILVYVILIGLILQPAGMDLEDLPPIEELNISVEKSELTKIGKVHAIVTKQVVVQAIKGHTPLDIDSVLFLSNNEPLGRINEVFGPVCQPFYVVVCNSTEDIKKKYLSVGTEIYFAPKKQEITLYIFLDALRQQKGSDASWIDNNEPPEEFLDYSDDEQERIAKSKRRAKNRNLKADDEVDIVVKSNSKNEDSGCDSTKHFTRKSVVLTRTENSRFSSKPSYSHSMNLNNIPVWMSSPPPPFLAMAPLRHNAANSPHLRFPYVPTLSPPPPFLAMAPLWHNAANSPHLRFPYVNSQKQFLFEK